MIRFEEINRRSNEILYSTGSRKQARERVHSYVDEGVALDDLDVIAVSKKWRKSQLGRSFDSPVRSILAESQGEQYIAFRTLAEAKAAPCAAAILEGDWGGQIFVTSPVKLIECTEDRLIWLAAELERRIQEANGLGSARAVFEPLPVGAFVAGGLGGARIINGVWVHEEIRQLGWADPVANIITGTRDDLPPPKPDVPEDVRLGMLRAFDEQIDVFWNVFDFDPPEYLTSLTNEEISRREREIVPPPRNYSTWYNSTFLAVVQKRGLWRA